ncbi:MAG: hypothetical protein K0R43_1290 [Pseudoduganella sp.]|jgi:hypothetical protein|nr:hypothetical protein [Pseudoduganella sp.]
MKAAYALALPLLAAALPAAAQAPLRLDQEAIREAVRATVAEMPKLQAAEGRADFGGGTAAEKGAQAKIDRAFAAAQVPYCLHADATRHVPIRLGGVLGLPGWFYAAATGKCK